MAAEKVEMVLVRTEDKIVADAQSLVTSPDFTPAILDGLLVRVPLIQRLYLFDRQGKLLFPLVWTGEGWEAVDALVRGHR